MADSQATRRRVVTADTDDVGERNNILATKLLGAWNDETILKIEWSKTATFKGWVATTTA